MQQKGDAKAQKLIYECYAPVMMSVCWRYVGDKETAKDMLQDGFIKLFLKLDMYAEPSLCRVGKKSIRYHPLGISEAKERFEIE